MRKALGDDRRATGASVREEERETMMTMSRQACFYRVPPQELHRRNQLLAEPAKTRAPLHSVIEVKVGGRGAGWG